MWEIFVDIGYFTAITMCYFLVEGYGYTHSKEKYGNRLLIFAAISQIPFCLAFTKEGVISFVNMNMIFTLFLCFLILQAMEKMLPGMQEKSVYHRPCAGITLQRLGIFGTSIYHLVCGSQTGNRRNGCKPGEETLWESHAWKEKRHIQTERNCARRIFASREQERPPTGTVESVREGNGALWHF